MSDNTDFDPFAKDADVSDAVPADTQDAATDSVVLDDGIDDLFAGAEFDLSEEDSGEAVRVYEAGDTYTDPLTVGIKHNMWVPVRLTDTAFKEAFKPRLSSQVCVAVRTNANGKRQVFVPFDRVEAEIKAGAEEVIGDLELPYILANANHVTPEFGQRKYPYEIEVPALTVKTAFFKKQNSGRTGYKNENGHSLRQATGATKAGDRVAMDTLPEIVSRMEDKIVMARVSIVTKTKTRPATDLNGKPISVKVADPDEGTIFTVFSPEPGSYVVEGSGEIWEGEEKLLVPVPGRDRIFALRDSGDDSTPLMESYVQNTDYINPPFLPVPERSVEVEMTDGTKAKGEITYGTIGAIAKTKAPGVPVDVLIGTGASAGRVITAIWLGTQWNELPPKKTEGEDGEKAGGGLDEFAGVEGL